MDYCAWNYLYLYQYKTNTVYCVRHNRRKHCSQNLMSLVVIKGGTCRTNEQVYHLKLLLPVSYFLWISGCGTLYFKTTQWCKQLFFRFHGVEKHIDIQGNAKLMAEIRVLRDSCIPGSKVASMVMQFIAAPDSWLNCPSLSAFYISIQYPATLLQISKNVLVSSYLSSLYIFLSISKFVWVYFLGRL